MNVYVGNIHVCYYYITTKRDKSIGRKGVYVMLRIRIHICMCLCVYVCAHAYMRSGVILSAYVVRIYISVCVYICVRVLTDRGNGTDGQTDGH